MGSNERVLGSVTRGEEGRANYRWWMMQHGDLIELCLLRYVLWGMGGGLGS